MLISKGLLLIQKIRKADIVKVFTLTAISTFVKMLTGFISIKVVAIIIGPSGIALLGQLNNFATIALTVASGGINNGVVKYIAEYKESDKKIKLLLSTAAKFTLYSSLAVGLVIILFRGFLSKHIMLSYDYSYVFVYFGLTIIFYAFNMLLSSILNGFKEFKRYVAVNIVGSILGLIFSFSLVLLYNLKGALISAVTFQSIMFFVSLYMVWKLPWIRKEYFKEKFNSKIANKLLKYTLMTFVSAATVPVSQLILRGYVISNLSTTEAGWWEAMNRISNMYLMVITSAFGVYYLPRLSEIKANSELRHEIIKSYKIILPALLIGFVIIYFSRFLIVKLLFTSAFSPMEILFSWQLIGDFFKITSWLLAFLMVAKSMTKAYISTEIFFSFLYVGLGFLYVKFHGIEGLTQAYMITYILYALSMFILFRKLIFSRL